VFRFSRRARSFLLEALPVLLCSLFTCCPVLPGVSFALSLVLASMSVLAVARCPGLSLSLLASGDLRCGLILRRLFTAIIALEVEASGQGCEGRAGDPPGPCCGVGSVPLQYFSLTIVESTIVKYQEHIVLSLTGTEGGLAGSCQGHDATPLQAVYGFNCRHDTGPAWPSRPCLLTVTASLRLSVPRA